jgi:hypothetical protein
MDFINRSQIFSTPLVDYHRVVFSNNVVNDKITKLVNDRPLLCGDRIVGTQYIHVINLRDLKDVLGEHYANITNRIPELDAAFEYNEMHSTFKENDAEKDTASFKLSKWDSKF